MSLREPEPLAVRTAGSLLKWLFLGSLCNKDHSIVGSILGPRIFGNPPMAPEVPKLGVHRTPRPTAPGSPPSEDFVPGLPPAMLSFLARSRWSLRKHGVFPKTHGTKPRRLSRASLPVFNEAGGMLFPRFLSELNKDASCASLRG